MTVLTVRRSSDDATSSFTASEISGGTLLSWVTAQDGSADGFVVEWRAATGGGHDLSQPEVGDQPKIVGSGSLLTEDGEATIKFDGINDGFEAGHPSSEALTVALRAAPTDIAGPPHVLLNVDGLRVSEYDDEIIAMITNGDAEQTSWSKPGTYNGAGPIGLAVFDGRLFAANRDSDDVSVWGNGEAVRLPRQAGTMPIVAGADSSTLALHVAGADILAAHSVSRSQTAAARVALARGSTQSGLFGGSDEDLDGSVQQWATFDELKSQPERNDLIDQI
jgi:antitoxin component of MazEF toxin-antitoxin module